jgi:hypothetical protein
MMKRLSLAVLALLAACGTPQEQCIRQNTRDLRTVERLIAETQGNLDRGYAYETITEYDDYWAYCPQPQVPGTTPIPDSLCLKERAVTVQRPKAIDLNDEARKLESLKTKRVELSRRAEALIASCKEQYPE